MIFHSLICNITCYLIKADFRIYNWELVYWITSTSHHPECCSFVNCLLLQYKVSSLLMIFSAFLFVCVYVGVWTEVRKIKVRGYLHIQSSQYTGDFCNILLSFLLLLWRLFIAVTSAPIPSVYSVLVMRPPFQTHHD